jgi:hypothetical protein
VGAGGVLGREVAAGAEAAPAAPEAAPAAPEAAHVPV